MGSDSSHPLQQFSAQEGWSLGASAATSVNIKETPHGDSVKYKFVYFSN